MKSVPWRVLGSLVALGLGAPLSGSAEELPQPGKYAGTLTVRHIVDGKAEDPDVVARAVYRVSGRVGSNGDVRIVYAAEREPILGRFITSLSGPIILLAFDSIEGVTTTRNSFKFSYPDLQNPLVGPNNVTAAYTIEYATKLTRVGK